MVMRPRRRRLGAVRQAVDDGGEVGGVGSGFGGFIGEFDFDADIEGRTPFVEAAGEFGGVDGLDDMKEFARQLGLVGLKVADEVEAGVGEVGDEGGFGSNSWT